MTSILNTEYFHSLVIKNMYIAPHLKIFDCSDELYCSFSDPDEATANYVGFKTNVHENYRIVIENTHSEFKKQKIPFCWICDDLREADIASHLRENKFTKADTFWNMRYDPSCNENAKNPSAIVKEVDVSLLLKYKELIASLLNSSMGYVEQVLLKEGYKKHESLRAYAAYDSSMNIAGFALLIEDKIDSIALLCLAAVRTEYRNQGFYKALVNNRIAAAQKNGAKYILSYAYENSAKILQKIGMKKYASFTMYKAPSVSTGC